MVTHRLQSMDAHLRRPLAVGGRIVEKQRLAGFDACILQQIVKDFGTGFEQMQFVREIGLLEIVVHPISVHGEELGLRFLPMNGVGVAQQKQPIMVSKRQQSLQPSTGNSDEQGIPSVADSLIGGCALGFPPHLVAKLGHTDIAYLQVMEQIFLPAFVHIARYFMSANTLEGVHADLFVQIHEHASEIEYDILDRFFHFPISLIRRSAWPHLSII